MRRRCVLASVFVAAGMGWQLFGAAPSLTFRESIVQHLVRYHCSGSSYSITTSGSQSGAFSGHMPLADVDPAQFDASTPVSVQIGNFSMSGILGDDPRYYPGRRVATLKFGGSHPSAGFRVRWSDRTLTVQGLTGDLYSYGIAARSLEESSGFVKSDIEATVQLGDFYFNRPLHVRGVSNPRVINLCGTPFYIPNIYVRGSTDYVRPTITLLRPSRRNRNVLDEAVEVAGVARDNVGLASVQVRINDGLWHPADGTRNWSVVVPLVAGTNLIWAKSLDLDGNESVVRQISVQH